ncbi:antibiotic biosynthesis monooxygenase [Silicimonas algicola]|uniref:Heme-degrading monooxygenase HmoA n=1 Tax=Silicimonas algicola TaxID=1826607 RepID=A0A316G7S4_9RHOB|nr:antibiotic biosynthesis monooxygenase [Silicimonas algicola]AZQ67348.1 antibiotic biosynthesis monooxygenase [Silicimonas algicola]PWK57029.1 heme-degrading monooxygenase HmoA [Silicimonas algicola]
MIAVIFEVWPKDGHVDTYLDIAASLREELTGHPGFISVERFRSITDPEKLLSLSFFEDEAALDAWRQRPRHRAAQSAGRHEHFADYRLRIAGVIRDYGMTERDEAPQDSRALNG